MLLNYAEEVLGGEDNKPQSNLNPAESESDTDSDSDEDDSETDSETDDETSSDEEDYAEQRRDATRLLTELGSTNEMLQLIADMIADNQDALDGVIAILRRMLTTGTEHVVLAVLNAENSNRMTREEILDFFDTPQHTATTKAFMAVLTVTKAQVAASNQPGAVPNAETKRVLGLGNDVSERYWKESFDGRRALLAAANKSRKSASGRAFAVPPELLGDNVDYNKSVKRAAKDRNLIEDTSTLDTTVIGRKVAQRALYKLLNPTRAFEWFGPTSRRVDGGDSPAQIEMDDSSDDSSDDEDWLAGASHIKAFNFDEY